MSKRKSEFHQVTWEQAATCWKKKAEKLQAEVERLRAVNARLVEAAKFVLSLPNYKRTSREASEPLRLALLASMGEQKEDEDV